MPYQAAQHACNFAIYAAFGSLFFYIFTDLLLKLKGVAVNKPLPEPLEACPSTPESSFLQNVTPADANVIPQPKATAPKSSRPQIQQSLQSPPSIEPTFSLHGIKTYKLHKRAVVYLKDLSFSVPTPLRRYMLRGEPVVRCDALELLAA